MMKVVLVVLVTVCGIIEAAPRGYIKKHAIKQVKNMPKRGGGQKNSDCTDDEYGLFKRVLEKAAHKDLLSDSASGGSQESSLSNSFMKLFSFIRYSYLRPCQLLHKADHYTRTSREAQALASVVQLALLDNKQCLCQFDKKLSQNKLGLCSEERKHVEELVRDFRLDKEGRLSVPFLEPFYVALYEILYARVSEQNRVIVGSGNTHRALIPPTRLKDMLDKRYDVQAALYCK